MAPALPYSGYRVIALEQAVAGPFCTRQLADLGADVVKIEHPVGGDFARGYDTACGATSSYFAWLNRGKRSVALDLKTDVGRATLQRLMARADVFLHNLGAGAVERLGLGYEDLAAQHPRLIWCGISGYGPDGPYRNKKAYDLLVQAESGVISLTGTPAARAKVGVSVADIASGHYAYSSIAAALLQRERGGGGQRIDISMLECLVEWMMPTLHLYEASGKVPEPAGLRHHMVVPYGAFDCADGTVVLSVQHEREWQRFCAVVMAAPALAMDPAYASNELRVRHRAGLEARIEERLSRLTTVEALALLERAEIASATINDAAAVRRHPQLAARGRWTEVDSPGGPLLALIPPHNLRGAPAVLGAVPALGEHTSGVLAEWENKI